MCGIAGCIAPAGEPARPALEAMAKALHHRGPDDHGIEVSGQVGFVQTRLAIVDPTAAGHQPMADPSGRWLLTYNGEIFNHLELRDGLPPIPYRGHSDTETLLHALAHWGEDAMTHLNGQFAFAAFDRKGRRLLLVRDHFGIKPLYVTWHDGALWFASEMKALLVAGIPRNPELEVLADSAAHWWRPGADTPLKGIKRVSPGSVLSVDVDTLEGSERRWYRPAQVVDPELAAELEGRSRAELTEMLESRLQVAVGRQLMSDVPLGSMCSGGLDSSLITALARHARPKIVAYTVSLPEDPADELRQAERVAKSLDIDLVTVEMSATDWRAELVPAVLHHEYPLSPVVVPIARLARSASDNGTKVMLAGEAADGLFGGMPGIYRHLYRDALGVRMRLRRSTDALRGLGLSRVPRSAIRTLKRELRRRMRYTPQTSPMARASDPNPVQHDLDPALLEAYAHHPGPVGRLETALLGGRTRGILPWLLNRMDKNGLQSSVEVRVPFLDPEVVSLVANLPLKARIGPQPKGILRDVARRWLPAEVAKRPKRVGLAPDVRRLIAPARPSFVGDGRLRETLRVPAPEWNETLHDLTSTEAVRVLTAEAWCRLFLDGESVEAVETELWTA